LLKKSIIFILGGKTEMQHFTFNFIRLMGRHLPRTRGTQQKEQLGPLPKTTSTKETVTISVK